MPFLTPSLCSVSDALDEQYEQAEAQYLDAIRQDRSRRDAAALAQAVAHAAAAWNAAAYERLHKTAGGDERHQLDRLTERTEVLAELWADLAAAYGSGS